MTDEKYPAIYIMAKRYRGTMYVGVTSKLWDRVCDHKNETFDGFTKEQGLKSLVWYQHYDGMDEAIRAEKLLKKWRREWKIRIIEELNADWRDLHDHIDGRLGLEGEKAGPRPSPG